MTWHRLGASGWPPAPDGGGERRRQLDVAFDSSPIGTAVTTDNGTLVQANATLGRLLGVPPAGLLGRRLEDLAARDVVEQVTAGRQQMLARGAAHHVTDSLLVRADGSSLPVTLTCARVPASSDGQAYLVVHVQDATERQTTEAELTHRWLHDPLTGLPNRVLLVDRLTRALARLERHPAAVSVLFVDLDGFKLVNDRHGHTVGDQILVEVASRLQSLQRTSDTACRFGGDEFVVLCEDSGAQQAAGVARRIRASLAVPIDWAPAHPQPPGALSGPLSTRLTASIGVASTSDPASTAHQLLHDADSAMYQAKPE